MGIYLVRQAGDIGDSYVLAPERYDPRRTINTSSGKRIDDLAFIITENISTKNLASGKKIQVLDTTHAYDGFIILRHDPVSINEIGSSKRYLKPGDVIISRLRPYLRQVAYIGEDLFHAVPDGNDVCASTEFFVIRGREGFDAACLVPFLLTTAVQNALAAGQEGGHHPRFSKELLASIRVPNSLIEESEEISKKVKDLSARLRKSLIQCREIIDSMENRNLDNEGQ